MPSPYIESKFAGATEQLTHFFGALIQPDPIDVLEESLDQLLIVPEPSRVEAANILATAHEAIREICESVRVVPDEDVVCLAYMGLAKLVQDKFNASDRPDAYLAQLRSQLAESINNHSGREPITFGPRLSRHRAYEM